jgi:hypothetical protein
MQVHLEKKNLHIYPALGLLQELKVSFSLFEPERQELCFALIEEGNLYKPKHPKKGVLSVTTQH